MRLRWQKEFLRHNCRWKNSTLFRSSALLRSHFPFYQASFLLFDCWSCCVGENCGLASTIHGTQCVYLNRWGDLSEHFLFAALGRLNGTFLLLSILYPVYFVPAQSSRISRKLKARRRFSRKNKFLLFSLLIPMIKNTSQQCKFTGVGLKTSDN